MIFLPLRNLAMQIWSIKSKCRVFINTRHFSFKQTFSLILIVLIYTNPLCVIFATSSIYNIKRKELIMTNMNNVILEGVIVHKFVTPKIAILTIGTGNATPTPNYPKVLYFGDFIKTIEENYNVGDHVKATGNIQSSKKRSDIKNQNLVSIFGEGIEKSESIMKEKFGIESDNSFYRFKNEINIAGEVTKIEQTFSNIVKIRVLTNKNNRISYVNMVYYTDKPEMLLSDYHVGDNVGIIGCVQTTKKSKDGETHHFENYVINEIHKI